MSETPAEDKSHADIGLVCALPMECGALLERCERSRKYSGGDFVFRGGVYDGIRLAIAQTGVGFARARRATQALLEAHTPAWVLSIGFSGGLLPEMKVGHIALANAICDTHGNELPVDCPIPEDRKRGLFVGRHVNTDELVRTVDEKKALADTHDAIAVDMESLAVAQVCKQAGRPFLSIRVVSDDLSADLPPEIHSLLGSTGTQRWGAAFGAILKRPGSVKDMWQLRESANTCAAKLATFLDGVITQLHAAAK